MNALEQLYSPPEIGAPGKRRARAMRRDLRLAGLAFLVMLGIFLAAGALLAPGGRAGDVDRLRVYFADAGGLEPGIPVLAHGYTIGVVETVEPLLAPAGRDAEPCTRAAPAGAPCFRAILRIRRDWPLAADSQATLGSAGLLKGGAILVEPGTAAARLSADAVLASQPRAPELLDRLDRLAISLQATVDDSLAPALASLRVQIDNLGQMLGTGPDADAPAPLDEILANLVGLSADLRAALDRQQLDATFAAVQRLAEQMAAFSATLETRGAELGATARDYGALANELRAFVASQRPAVSGTLDDLHYLARELASALAPILADLGATARDLAAAARELRQQPSLLIRGREPTERAPWFRD